MNHSKRNVHNTGPLGMLVKTGQISKVFDEQVNENSDSESQQNMTSFETKYGVKFSENELITVDPNECEPWQYANRLEENMGDLDELVESIRQNKQLQPILIRPHLKPHGQIKYEIIFGRRRHLACLKLGVPLLAIKKDLSNTRDAIAIQDAENRSRDDVSNYSNAILYKKLMDDGIFKEQNDLAQKLGISKQAMSDLMVYTKIPKDIVNNITNINNLSVSIALKIASVLKKDPNKHKLLLELAPEIGASITSAKKLEKAILSDLTKRLPVLDKNTFITKNSSGDKLFTVRVSLNGKQTITLEKKYANKIDPRKLCDHLKIYFEKNNFFEQSGTPD